MTVKYTNRIQITPDLDEQTKEELQPPCDAKWGPFKNPNECHDCADLAAFCVCAVCDKSGWRLMCKKHFDQFTAPFNLCGVCGGVNVVDVVRSEPLR